MKNKKRLKNITKEQYNVDFGIRSDKKLGNYLKEQGYPSLSKLLDLKKNDNK